MNTEQQEFDAVVNHLYTQGMPAKDGSYHFSHIAGYLKELANIEDLTFTDPRRAA